MDMNKKIAIVGAGISGLACAYDLQKKGFEVVVFEKEAIVGGRMSSQKKDNLIFDIGANHLCNLYDNMKELCKELDIPFEPMKFLNYGVYKKKKIYEIKKSVSILSQIRLAIDFLFISKKTLNLDFFDLTTSVKYDKKNAYDHMKRLLGKSAADYIVDPFSSTYQFHSAKEISLSAVRSVMSLIKYRHKDWDLHQLPQGMIHLPRELSKKLDVRLNTPVKKVVGGVKPALYIDDKKQEFDAIVMASTANVTQKIYTNSTKNQSKLLEGIKYSSTISIAFKVPKKLLPDIAIVWVPKVESDTISGYTNEKMKGGEFVDGEYSLICAWLHEDYAKKIMNKSDEELYLEIKKELLKYCPWFLSTDQLEGYDIKRWKQAMPKFYPGSVTLVKEFLDNGQGEQQVFFCGDYLNSPWTEGALRCGQRVAQNVIDSL